MADYLEVTCRLPLAAEERLADLLGSVRVLGVHIVESDGLTISVAVYLEGSRTDDVARVREVLGGAGAHDVSERPLDARDWLAGWRESARPFTVGRSWWVDPHPDAPSTPPDGRMRLLVEPRTAFGSGTHESTRLVLAELEGLEVGGRSVLDIGTGSGILAIAADRLGARPVVAFDLDAEALWVARRTVSEQDWPSRPLLFAGSIAAIGECRFDIVLCNMISEELRPLLHEVRRALAPDGVAVLSGALCAELGTLRLDLEAAGLSVRSERQLDEWCCATVVRHAG